MEVGERGQYTHVVEDEESIIRTGTALFCSLQRRHALRRTFLGAVGVLILLSVLSFLTIFKDITQPGVLDELEFDLFRDAHNSSSPGWRVIVNLTDSALASFENDRRPTLTEAFFPLNAQKLGLQRARYATG
jgi:hypothetical protein